MPERPVSLLFTCEHAGNRIPSYCRGAFSRAGVDLESHRGHDPGALELARRFARRFRAPLFTGRWSRLLVELNRSPHHPRLWSEFSQPLPESIKRKLMEEYYLPYRRAVEEFIQRETGRRRRVLHISVHSFTPVLDGEKRRADIGLLYDPRRSGERRFCGEWADALRAADPGLVVRNNYPYRGVADGFTTHLRRRFGNREYAGIELEVNQKHPAAAGAAWRRLQRMLVESIAAIGGASAS